MGVFTIQQLVGPVLMIGYATYFFELAGLKDSEAFSASIGVATMAIVGNILSWPLVNSYGRRWMFLNGTLWLLACLLLTGILDVLPDDSRLHAWWQSAMCALYQFVYYL